MKTATIHPPERFVFDAHKWFFEELKKVTGTKDKIEFIIDFSKTKYLDSAALGLLLIARDRVNGTVVLKNVSMNDSVAQTIDIANFGKLFEIR